MNTYQLHQLLVYEDDKVSYTGYIHEITKEDITVLFNPFTADYAEDYVYRGTGKETHKMYDLNLFATETRICSPIERQEIDEGRKAYKQLCKLCIAARSLYAIDPATGTNKVLNNLLAGRYYLIPKHIVKELLSVKLKELKDNKYSIFRLASLTKLKYSDIKELLRNA